MVRPTNNISFSNALKFLNEFRYKKKKLGQKMNELFLKYVIL